VLKNSASSLKKHPRLWSQSCLVRFHFHPFQAHFLIQEYRWLRIHSCFALFRKQHICVPIHFFSLSNLLLTFVAMMAFTKVIWNGFYTAQHEFDFRGYQSTIVVS
jgi:uncharacterized membrane protein YoaT (DUF817 family)